MRSSLVLSFLLFSSLSSLLLAQQSPFDCDTAWYVSTGSLMKELCSLQCVNITSLKVVDAVNLVDFTGCESIKQIQEYFEVTDTASLTSLAGFDSLTQIGDYFLVKDNPSLTQVEMPSLQTVGKYFEILNHPALSTVSFKDLLTVAGELEIENNTELVDIYLPSLLEISNQFPDPGVDYELRIMNNGRVATLEIGSLQQVENIVIKNETLLEEIICDNLQSGGFILENNTALARVQSKTTNRFYYLTLQIDDCPSLAALSFPYVLQMNLYLNGLPSLTNLSDFGSVTTIMDFSLNNTAVQELPFSDDVMLGTTDTQKVYEFTISNNTELESISWSPSVVAVSIVISQNSKLQTISGFNQSFVDYYSSCMPWVYIQDNPSLLQISGFNGVPKLGYCPQTEYTRQNFALVINGNDVLETVSGFTNVSTISYDSGGGYAFQTPDADAAGLYIADNKYLTSLSGFRKTLAYLSDYRGGAKTYGTYYGLFIARNPSLQHLFDLKSLQSVSDQLGVMDNDALRNIDGLYGISFVKSCATIVGNSNLNNCLNTMCKLTSEMGQSEKNCEENGFMNDDNGINCEQSLC